MNKVIPNGSVKSEGKKRQLVIKNSTLSINQINIHHSDNITYNRNSPDNYIKNTDNENKPETEQEDDIYGYPTFKSKISADDIYAKYDPMVGARIAAFLGGLLLLLILYIAYKGKCKNNTDHWTNRISMRKKNVPVPVTVTKIKLKEVRKNENCVNSPNSPIAHNLPKIEVNSYEATAQWVKLHPPRIKSVNLKVTDNIKRAKSENNIMMSSKERKPSIAKSEAATTPTEPGMDPYLLSKLKNIRCIDDTSTVSLDIEPPTVSVPNLISPIFSSKSLFKPYKKPSTPSDDSSMRSLDAYFADSPATFRSSKFSHPLSGKEEGKSTESFFSKDIKLSTCASYESLMFEFELPNESNFSDCDEYTTMLGGPKLAIDL